jgi:ribose transport system ATP-binding protein
VSDEFGKIDVGSGLTILGATKAFGATMALDDVDLRVEPGEIRALIGANGSGKSTLIKSLAGYHTLDQGRVFVKGRELALSRLGDEAKPAGLRFVHQDLALIPSLSIAENLALERGYIRGTMGTIDKKRQIERARSQLRTVGLHLDPRIEVSQLGPVEKTLVAVTRALDHVDPTANVLLLDEPTARLPQTDAQRLADILIRLAELGLPIVYVTHRLEEVYRLAQTITVLRDGRNVHEGLVRDLPRGELGTLISGSTKRRPPMAHRRTEAELKDRPPALKVTGMSTARLRDIDLSVESGEIVGVTGLVGSGRSELGRVVYGMQPYESGEIVIAGKAAPRPMTRAFASGSVGYSPQERRDGLLAGLMIMDNLAITSLEGMEVWYGVSKSAVRAKARKTITDLGVIPNDPDALIDALSGGNQQKVALGKWVRLDLDLLILDEPTQSIDVGAKVELMEAITARAKGLGMGVLWFDSDVDEIVRYSDRILVMTDGRITDEFREKPFAAADILLSVYGEGVLEVGR